MQEGEKGKKEGPREEDASRTRATTFPICVISFRRRRFFRVSRALLRRGMKPGQLPCQLPRLMAVAISISRAIREREREIPFTFLLVDLIPAPGPE